MASEEKRLTASLQTGTVRGSISRVGAVLLVVQGRSRGLPGRYTWQDGSGGYSRTGAVGRAGPLAGDCRARTQDLPGATGAGHIAFILSTHVIEVPGAKNLSMGGVEPINP